MPAATASIGTLMVPVIGVLASGVMLHEPLGIREFTALAFTLGGGALAVRSKIKNGALESAPSEMSVERDGYGQGCRKPSLPR